MARILFAWELGLGLGHLVRLRPLVQELARRGHRIFVAAKDLSRIGGILGDTATLLAAPWNCRRAPRIAPVLTYADLLSNIGFDDCEALASYTAAWRNLFALIQPDAVVCDHSPTALLAARISSLPAATVGTGFFCPIDESPLRPFRPASAEQTKDAYDRELQVLENINQVLRSNGSKMLDRATQFYGEGARHFLLTFAELDHFPDRVGADYRGAWPYGLAGQPYDPASACLNVFAYLKPFAALEEFLIGLSRRPIRAVIYIDGARHRETVRPRNGPLEFPSRPIDIRQAAQGCDVAVTNATHGTSVAILLAGKPLVQVPIYLEQALLAAATDRLGASLSASPKSASGILKAFDKVRAETSFKHAAQRFAQRYRGFPLEQSQMQIVDELEGMARSC